MTGHSTAVRRRRRYPRTHLAGFSGFMHSDGYAGFDELTRSGAVREVACLAHVRRKFVVSLRRRPPCGW
ncbi:IS66 family transposase [Acuticoccus kalidii]|uniref:IS66 family transposase n=1 Tax=Acuticoccus kalidii TaxID=2910977 RepID=UPI0034E1DB13